MHVERHQVTDFRSDPASRALWVCLDDVPTDTWVSRLDRALDDAVHRMRPVVADGDRVVVRIDGVNELDALTLLFAYVDAANRSVACDHPSERSS